MALSLRCLLRRISKPALRNSSTAAETAPLSDEPIQIFRTNEDNPVNHTSKHFNRFYVMPPAVTERLFCHGGLPKKYRDQIVTFFENAIMVREPAVDVISCLNQTDYSRSVNKYVLYGGIGSGKTMSLAHILHYGLETKKVLVHVPWVPDWFRRPKEVARALTKEGFFDLPIDAAAWLIHFKHQNAPLLSELDLRMSKDYIWNAREQNLTDSPLLQLIDFGIARVKYASGIIEALLNEIKVASTAGKCNTLVVIDGYNAFLGKDTNVRYRDSNVSIRIKTRNLDPVYPDRITITEPFINLTKYDWCNGAIVLTVDEFAVRNTEEEHESILPRYLLGKEGFDHLDPFLPVEVKDYSPDEFEAIMEYYKNRKWVRNITDNGQRELELLSNRNPYKLMRYTAPL